MQTFLCGSYDLGPETLFWTTATMLDMKRLGKQRVEAYQILLTNLLGRKAWRNHPAVRMWRSYEYALAKYGIAMCNEWILRGYKDTLKEKFQAIIEWLPEDSPTYPTWLCRQDIAMSVIWSHRDALLAKDPSHYSQVFAAKITFRGIVGAPPMYTEYVWPEDSSIKNPYWY